MNRQVLLTFIIVAFPCFLLVLAISFLYFGRAFNQDAEIDQLISQYFVSLDEKNATSLDEDLFPSSESEDYAASLLRGLQDVDSIVPCQRTPASIGG